MSTKIAYILTSFPSPSETFVQAEITSLKNAGLDITILAAKNINCAEPTLRNCPAYYKPDLFSKKDLTSVTKTIFQSPLLTIKIACLILHLNSIKDSLTIVKNLHTICHFVSIIKKHNITHIHACFASWPAVIALAVNQVTKTPFSFAAHARDVYVESGDLKIKTKYAKFLICCTRQTCEHIKKLLPEKYHKKIYLNYHAPNIDPAIFDKADKQIAPATTIIAVGRLIPKKGFEDLINAMPFVLKKTPETSLTIIGSGPLHKKLKKQIQRLNLTSKIHLIGWLDHYKTLQMIRNAKILVAPSTIDKQGDRDGLPNVIIEAFALKTPVIAANLPSITEAVKHNITGLIVPQQDPLKLADAINYLSKNPILAKKFTQNAQLLIEENFNINNNTSKLISLLKKL